LASWYPNKNDSQWGIFHQKLLASLGQDILVTVIHIYSSESEEITESQHNNLREIRIASKPILGRNAIRRLMNRRRQINSIVSALRPQPQILHLLAAIPLGWIYLLSPRLQKIPLLYSESWSGWLPQRHRHRSHDQKWLLRYLAGKATVVAPVSNYLSAGMQMLGAKGNYMILPNIIDTAKPTPPEKPLEPYCLFVGDLYDDVKNISGILQAYQLSSFKMTEKLYIIGDGPDRTKLLEISEKFGLLEQVKFLGRLSNEEVYTFMRTCTFGIINSRFETFGMTVLEFIANNKPVICTRCGGPEYFWQDEMGILVDMENTQGLSLALLELSNNHSQYSPLKNCADVLFRHSRDIIGAQLKDIYHSMLIAGR
jgi:glycosyltransferase involved in cell wall biosynthesis